MKELTYENPLIEPDEEREKWYPDTWTDRLNIKQDETICFCCSLDDEAYMMSIIKELATSGALIQFPQFFLGRRPDVVEKNILMKTHFKKVQMSNKVIGVFKSKIGVNTLLEIGYALAFPDKRVYIISDLELPDEFTKFNRITILRDDTR